MSRIAILAGKLAIMCPRTVRASRGNNLHHGNPCMAHSLRARSVSPLLATRIAIPLIITMLLLFLTFSPVAADSNFGKESKGASENSSPGNFVQGSWYTLSEDGTAQSITAYIKYGGVVGAKIKYAIYEKSGALQGVYVAETSEYTVQSGDDGWKTLDLTSPASLSAGDYWLAYHVSNTVKLYYADDASNDGFYESQSYGSGLPLGTVNWDGGTTQEWSIYCTYTTSNPPTVTSSNATDATTTGAILYGNITDTGGANATVRGFEWGTSTGNYTTSWNETGSYGTGAFNHTLSGLTPATTYYWRAWATNPTGTGNSTELIFTTLSPIPSPPTNLAATQNGVSGANVTWTKGAYATNTYIRASTESYPESITDGYEVYNNTGTSVEMTGLDFSFNTYYISAWSWNSQGYSTTCATTKIGGESMVFLGILGLCGIMSFLSFRNSFFLFKLLAGATWIGFWAYFKDYPPGPITEGSSVHTILLIVIAFIGVAIVIAGLGRGIERTEDATGAFSIKTSGFNFKVPSWLKNPETEAREHRVRTTQDYRDRIHRGLNPQEREFKRR